MLPPGALVGHITNDTAVGVVTGFMIRGNNHSYEVQWGIDRCTWHLDFELRPKPSQPDRPIGFWCGSVMVNEREPAASHPKKSVQLELYVTKQPKQ